jgi:hypothetical protein
MMVKKTELDALVDRVLRAKDTLELAEEPLGLTCNTSIDLLEEIRWACQEFVDEFSELVGAMEKQKFALQKGSRQSNAPNNQLRLVGIYITWSDAVLRAVMEASPYHDTPTKGRDIGAPRGEGFDS